MTTPPAIKPMTASITQTLTSGDIKTVLDDGTIEYRNCLGQLHNMVGSAVKHLNGTEFWMMYGTLHNINGPAVVYANGIMKWYQNGILHNFNGPAIIRPDCGKEYWLCGKQYSKLVWMIIKSFRKTNIVSSSQPGLIKC